MCNKHSDFFTRKPQQAGFTLIELLVAMLISLTLIFACTALYSSLKSSIQTAQKLATAQESLRGAFYLMSRSIRQGQNLYIGGTSGAPGTRLTVEYGEVPVDESGVAEKIYSCLGNMRSSGDKDLFSSDGTVLYCNDDPEDNSSVGQIIALDVEQLKFSPVTGNNEDGVEIMMKIAGMPESYSEGFSFTLALRQKILLDLAK